MANALYTSGKEALLDGTIIWTTDNIRVVLIDTGTYTVNLSTHANLSDIPVGARIATSGLLANKTATSGVADADDPLFSAVTGSSAEALALYKDTGSASSSRLLAYFDTVTGLPFTPNGGSAQIQWPNTSGKIFSV